MTTTEETLAPDALRLCHILKWESFDGYGFNLRAEKGKPGQFIGKVDEGSPAEAAGLREGDRIVEVNEANIAAENHKQVVQRIKTLPNETKLLVVDPDGEAYFKSQNIVIKGSLPCVKTIKTPTEPIKSPNDIKPPTDDNVSQKSATSHHSSDYENSTHTSIITNEAEKMSDNSAHDNMMNNTNTSLNLNMTAKELRAQLAAKKKYDPKKDNSVNFKKKYEIVQKL